MKRWVVPGVLLVALAISVWFNLQPVDDSLRDEKIDTALVYRDTIADRPVPAPYPVSVDTSTPLPAVIDTMAVVRAYYARKIYNRTLLDDSTAFIQLSDTLTMNSITTASLTFINRVPEKIITRTIVEKPPRNSIYLGVELATAEKPLVFFVTRYNRDNWSFSAGYDINTQTKMLGVAYRIKHW